MRQYPLLHMASSLNHPTLNQKMYIAHLANTEYIILTNIPCSKCFEKKYNCKTTIFSTIELKDVEEWEKIAATTLTGDYICNCTSKTIKEII